jgi:hypothetical protein
VTLANITDYVACEMYEKATDLWSGFSKNIFLGVGQSSLLLGALLTFYCIFYILPLPLALLLGLTGSFEQAAGCLVLYVLGCLQKGIVDYKFKVRGFWFLLHPLSFIGLTFIAWQSWYIAVRKLGYEWKGRVYRP